MRLQIVPLLLSTLVSVACASEPPALADAALGWVPPPSTTLTAYADCLETQGVRVTERIAAIVVVDDSVKLDVGKEACKATLDQHLRTIGGSGRKVKDERTKTFVDMLRWCTNYRGQWDQPADEPVFDRAADAERTRVFYACIDEIRDQPS